MSDQSEEKGDAIVEAEAVLSGSSFKVMWNYFTASGNKCVLLMLFLVFICSEIALVVSDYYIAFW